MAGTPEGDGASVPTPPRTPGQLIALLSKRWTLPVLDALAAGPRRYHQLHESLDGLSHKVLTEVLRRLEREGLVARQLDAGTDHTAARYALTDLGRSLEEPVGTLRQWVEDHWPAVDAARARWDEQANEH